MLTEESDSEDELESEEETVLLRLPGGQSKSPKPSTSAHTGNGVMADGGRDPPKVIQPGNNKRPRPAEKPAARQKVAQRESGVKPAQNDSRKSRLQTHKSVPVGQPAPSGEKMSSTKELTQTPRGGSTGQSAPATGRRPDVSPERPTQIHTDRDTGQIEPAAGRRPVGGPEGPSQDHRCVPPGQSEPTNGKTTEIPDRTEWRACTTQPLDRPFGPSYFIPGRVEGKPALCLIDTGCTTNLLGKHVFDRLPERLRGCLVESDTHGMMADGTRLPFYGVIQLKIRLKELLIEERLVVSRISEDVILGMPFLAQHSCTIDFNSTKVIVDGRQIECTDRHGRRLSSSVQLIRETTIPPETEMTLQCRVTAKEYCPVGLIEGKTDGLCLATSVNRPDHQGRVMVRCLNPAGQPLQVRAGTTVGIYTSIEEKDITEAELPEESPEQHEIGLPTHMTSLYARARENCQDPHQEEQLSTLLTQYQDVFSRGSEDMGRTTLVEHSIPVAEGTRPIRQPPRRLGSEKEAEAEKQVQELLGKGLIEPANGAWGSPVVLVRKKDNSWRFCIDYRRLNSVTRQDAYPLPRIDESLDALAGSRFFSTLDLVSGYWQVPLDADAQEKSAFVTRSGLWKWKVLPFGLTSAPATFQRLMEQVVHGLHWKTLLLYLDDIIVIAPDFETHLERLGEVLGRLRRAGLKLKPAKCELLQTEVGYLGHVVSQRGVSTDPVKTKAVAQWPTPKDLKELQAFLGTVGYYRQYIPGFATTAKPLTRLTGGKEPWQWTPLQQDAFEQLQKCLITAPVLGYPDPKKPYVLDTDASGDGVGAVLSQIQDGEERVIGYYSKTLTPPERNYCVTRKELLAVVKGVKHFRPYLYGQHFELRTDHASLLWLCRRKEPSDQVARWLETLAEFQYTLHHRAGLKHGNADGLSRRPCGDCKQCQRIEERDGGPTWQELTTGPADPSPVVMKTPETGKVVMEARPVQEITRNPAELVKEQTEGNGAVATIYQAVQTGQAVSKEQIEAGGPELKKLNQRLTSMRLNQEGVLEIQLAINEKPRWVAICPEQNRQTLIWQTHQMSHSGVGRTIARLQLTWYWVGLHADVRRIVRSCEVCQKAKAGGLQPTKGRQRMYAGRPWQKLAVDLVGPMPETRAGNRWILVITDHFTRWQDAIPVPDATAPVVAATLDQRVFCYLGLPEQLHSDQGAQFESQLMEELCTLWGVEKTHTTPYHPQSNGLVERGNRSLGDSLRTLLLRRGQEEWDLLLPQIMRAFRGTPHSVTGETANFMMLGRELRLPDQLQLHPPPADWTPQSDYCRELVKRLEMAHAALREQQRVVRHEDHEEPLLFSPGDMVWLENRRRRKGENPKLQAKFQGPYTVVKSWNNHTYQLERQGQTSIQNECRLKAFRPCPEEVGRAPVTIEPRRRPNMRGMAKRRERTPSPEPWLIPPPKPPAVEPLPLNPGEQADPAPLPGLEEEIRDLRETGGTATPTRTIPVARSPLTAPEQTPHHHTPTPVVEIEGRPKRESRKPIKYADYECYALQSATNQLKSKEEKCAAIGETSANQKIVEKENSRELFHYTQALDEEQNHQPEIAPFCMNHKQRAHGFYEDKINKHYLEFQTTEMEPTDEKSEIKDVLGEIAELNTPEKQEEGSKPWWLQEEQLLGDINLDFTEIETDSKPLVPAVTKTKTEVEFKPATNNKRVPMKEMSNAVPAPQDHATGGATLNEGLSTGAGTGGQENVPPVREQQMGRCTIQLVRVPADEPVQQRDPVERLWWVEPATDLAVRELMKGPDVTNQWCADCGFRGTKKRVRIHSLQHFCKYACECGFIKTSRDAVYDHQISKRRSQQHGGPEGRVYCVDEASYASFCESMAWEDPPPFGEAKPTRTGQPKQKAETPTQPDRPRIFTRLGPQLRSASKEPEVEQPKYRIPWTTEVLIKKTKERRQALGAELLSQMTIVKAALSSDRCGTPEEQFTLHAELEVMRQAYDRLSRE